MNKCYFTSSLCEFCCATWTKKQTCMIMSGRQKFSDTGARECKNETKSLKSCPLKLRRNITISVPGVSI